MFALTMSPTHIAISAVVFVAIGVIAYFTRRSRATGVESDPTPGDRNVLFR